MSAPAAAGADGTSAVEGDSVSQAAAGTQSFPPPPPQIKEMAESQEREDAEKLAAAMHMKTKGNELWSKGDDAGAVKEWQDALKACFSLACRGPFVSGEVLSLELSVQLNLAAAALKAGEGHAAIRHCSRALQLKPKHPKALYRLAKAHLLLNEFDEASAAAAALLEVESGDVGAVSLQQQIRREADLHKRQEKRLLQKMMGRPHSLEYLSEECNFPLTRSLPLTLLFSLQELQQLQQQGQMLPNLRKELLCLHVLGASAQHEGELSSPHYVKLEGREQVAVFFKGTYAQLAQRVPGILSNSECTFFPHLALYSTLGSTQSVPGGPSTAPQEGPPRSPRPLSGETLEDLRLLIQNNILTVVSESAMCTVDDLSAYASAAAPAAASSSRGEAAVRQLGGRLLLSQRRSRFPLLLHVPSAAEAARAARFAARNAAAAADSAAAAAERAKGKASPEAVAAAEAAAQKAAAESAAAAVAAEVAEAAADAAAKSGIQEHTACAKHASVFAFMGRA
ncbi:TPR domain-containing protein [Cyclospora cayetanensis]|uniref:TPR domain-containing protein n=1 Tax=Cyclospora cayetanensis TaxID=88456 RepID=A0A1D3CQS6_9EIME|nr:TPR domain-containing protein [Cyclospora cayetanensis]